MTDEKKRRFVFDTNPTQLGTSNVPYEQTTGLQDTERLAQQSQQTTFFKDNKRSFQHQTQISNAGWNDEAMNQIKEQVAQYKNDRQETFAPRGTSQLQATIRVGQTTVESGVSQPSLLNKFIRDDASRRANRPPIAPLSPEEDQNFVPLNQFMDRRAQSQGHASSIARTRRYPRKRYFNGVGKIQLPQTLRPKRELTQREIRSKQGVLSQQDDKSSQGSKPYPGYAFNFLDTLSLNMQTIQAGNQQLLNRPHDQVKVFYENSSQGLAQVTPGSGITNKLTRDNFEGVSTPPQDSRDGTTTIKSDNNTLFFTLDQYQWAQKQGFTNKPFLGHHSLGHKIERENQSKATIGAGLGGEDFMLEEAAVSHMIHKVDNIPLVHYPTINHIEEQSAGQHHRAQTTTLILEDPGSVGPNKSSLSPRSRQMSKHETRNIESTLLPKEYFKPDLHHNKSQQQARRSRYTLPNRRAANKSTLPEKPSTQNFAPSPTGLRTANQSRHPFHFGSREPPARLRGRSIEKEEPRTQGLISEPITTMNQSKIFIEEQDAPELKLEPLHSQSPGQRNMRYQYDAKPSEIREDQIQLSPGNMYHESTNPRMAHFVSNIQSHIQNSQEQKQSMKDDVGKIFKLMKRTKNTYIQTLLDGEDQGHCKGIKKRMDPTTKYRLQQQMQKYKQIQEDRVEEIKALKKIRDQEKLQAKLERVQDRLLEIERQKSTIYTSPVGRSSIRSRSKEADGSDGSFIQHKFSFKMDPNISRLSTKQVKINLDLGGGGKSVDEPKIESRQRTNKEDSAIMRMESFSSTNFDSIAETPQAGVPSDFQRKKNSKAFASLHRKGVTKMSIDYRKMGTQKKSGGPSSSAISMAQFAQKKVSQIKETFGLKQIGADAARALESSFLAGNSPNQQVLTKILRITQADDFMLFKQKAITGSGAVGGPKQNQIFSQFKQLGLSEDSNFQQFFQSLCEEEVSLKYCRLKRQAFKEILQMRYSKQVGEKILAFLENQFQTLYRIDFHGFCNVVMEFLNSGPDFYKKILFACLSLSNPGRICEHDLFCLLENFKQRDSYFFYKELINQSDVPRDFKEVVDDSDQIFFEAYAPDIKAISHAINFRKRLLGIEDQDTNQGMEDDLLPSNYNSEEEYEEDLVNQIDYIIGLVMRKSGTQYQADIAMLLAKATSLPALRNDFINFVVQRKIVIKKEKRIESQQTSVIGEQQQQTVNFFKPPQVVVPCLGSGIVGRTGVPISRCSYLNFEDFNKLVVFKKGKVPSFVEDLIDHITDGFLSVHMIETHLSTFREAPGGTGFPMNKNLQEFIAQKNVETYGHSQGVLPLSITAKKQKQGQKAVEKQKHVINTPFSIQDHYIGEEFVGKLLIRKVAAKKGFKKGGQEIIDNKELGISEFSQGDEEEHMGSESHSHQAQMKTNMQLISETKVYELINYRQALGEANFFRIFRAFYKLSNIPEDAQNNPFALWMDKASILRGFHSVFGIENEEMAVRFSVLFIQPLGLHKEYKTDLLRFLFVVQNLCEKRERNGSNYLELGFRFLDYDNNGNIGSVDILNLKKSLKVEKMDKIQKTFYMVAVRKQLHRNMVHLKSKIDHKVITHQSKSHSSVDKIFLSLFKKSQSGVDEDELLNADLELPEIEEEQNSQRVSTKMSNQSLASGGRQSYISLHSHDEMKPEMSEKERDETETSMSTSTKMIKDNPFEKISQQEEKIMTPFNKFVMEIQFLKDFFVKEVVMQKGENNKQVLSANQSFLNLTTYDKKFLTLFEQKFGVETPSIVHFFRSKLTYQFELSPKYKAERGSLYEGFYKSGHSREEGYSISHELVEMQRVLDIMSNQPKPLYLQSEQ